MRYGIDAKLFDWSDEMTADCPRRHSKNLIRPMRQCPDLSKAAGLICLASKPPSYMRRKPENHQGRKEEGSVIEHMPYAVSSP